MAAKKMAPYCLLSCLLILFPVLAFSLDTTFESSKIKKEINSNGPYIGLIAVHEAEEKAFFAANEFKPNSILPYVDLSGRRFHIGETQFKNVIFVRCGLGMVNAAATTQQLLDIFKVSGIVHFGIAGNTNSSLNIGDVVIPKQFVHTGLWDWLNPLYTKAASSSNDYFANLHIKNYNVPLGRNNNLGHIGFTPEEFYSKAGTTNVPKKVVFFNVFEKWLEIASALEGLELQQCVNSSICLKNKPKVVIGQKASTSNIFVDNEAYREFLFETIGVSSADMESTAVIMTSLSNGYPVIVIRGLSNLAGADRQNSNSVYKPLAAANVAQVVGKFIYLLYKLKLA